MHGIPCNINEERNCPNGPNNNNNIIIIMMGDDVIEYDPNDIENDNDDNDDDERRDMIVRTQRDVNPTTTRIGRGSVPDNDASRTTTILYCASVSILLNVTFLIVIVGMIMMMLMDGHPSPPLYNTTSMMTSRSNNSTTPSVSSVAVNVVTTSSLPSSRDCISGSSGSSSSSGSTTTTPTTAATPTTTTITTPTSDSNEQLRLRLQEKYLVTNVTRGVVASDQSICSQMAMERILQPYNGTAVDAAIFIALCLGVVNPASSGLGGGAFVLLHHTFNDDTHDNDDNDDDSSSNHSQQFYDARTISTTNHKTTQQNHNKNRKVNEVIDCRERAPMNANATMYHNLPPNASVYGTLAIPIMGELHCLSLAHARFGTVPWSTIVQPVIDMAMTDGIVVGSYLARQIHDTATHHIKLQQQDPYQQYYNRYGEYDSLRNLLTHNDDWSQPLREGDIFYNMELGATLQVVAQRGIRALYHPPFVTAIVDDIQALGPYGIITTADYQNYRPTIYTPLFSHESIQGYTIMGVPPPSSGGAALIGALRFLSNFTVPFASYPDTLTMHRIVEACKHVFSMRMSLSDPDYNTPIVQDVVHDFVASSYMDQLRQSYYNDTSTLRLLSLYGGTKWSLLNDTETIMHQNITDAKEGDRTFKQQRQSRRQQQQHQDQSKRPKDHQRQTQRTFGYLNDHGTSHFSVVDQYGNAVAMTTSINTNFGSHVRSPSLGIIFSNTMDDFSKPDLPNHYGLKPSISNYIQPGKRPLSSMTPTMVFRTRTHNANDDRSTDSHNDMGDLILVIGASGGPKIITAVLQVLIRIIYMGQKVFDAVLHPRIHNQLIYHNGAITATEQAKIVTSTNNLKSDDVGNDGGDDNKNNATIEYDINVVQRTRDALSRRNHELIDIDFSGTVQAIHIDYETNDPERPMLSGVSDPRKDGTPAGY